MLKRNNNNQFNRMTKTKKSSKMRMNIKTIQILQSTFKKEMEKHYVTNAHLFNQRF